MVSAGAKRFEDSLQKLLRNAAFVLNLDGNTLLITGYTNTNGRTRRAVLNCVGSQVRNGLKKSMLVPSAYAITLAFEGYPPALCNGFEFVDDTSTNRPQITRLGINR